MVEMIVGSSTIGASGGLVAGHAHICWVFELKAVLADSVLVIGVHAFRFAGSVANPPRGFLSWNATWDRKDEFCIESGTYCHEGALGLAVFSMLPVMEELDASGRCCHIGRNLSAQVL